MNADLVPALSWLEIRGFRAFGSEARRLDLSSSLVVVHAGNSQGKTSLAEAMEFLLTGRSSRRDLFGGAKAEYNASLRNAHLPMDAEVWVAAGIRDSSGVEREVRRTLVTDFDGASDCVSHLTVDGAVRDSLEEFGINPNEGAIGAPVLLQHTLRYVLSTEPKQRAAYFKALLELTDLDIFRQRIQAQHARIDGVPAGASLTAIDGLQGTQFADTGRALSSLKLTSPELMRDSERIVVEAGNRFLQSEIESVAALRPALEEARSRRADALFPMTALSLAPLHVAPTLLPDVEAYAEALQNVDQTLAELMPTFSALLAVPEYEHLDHAVDCPVCATPSALTTARIIELRDRLRAGEQLRQVGNTAADSVRQIQGRLNTWRDSLRRALPAAGSWTDEQRDIARSSFIQLCGEDAKAYEDAASFAKDLHHKYSTLGSPVEAVNQALTILIDQIERRVEIESELDVAIIDLEETFAELKRTAKVDEAFETLRRIVEPHLAKKQSNDGLDKLLDVIDQLPLLASDLTAAALKVATIKRLTAVERALKQAASSVLDVRFASMSSAIERWWLSIRPGELVSFAGVKRRAAGAIFVNLIAALQSTEEGAAVERDALGVYSDSQLNALGLSTFLARSELIDHSTVLLDDPIPGSDGDHRLTFVQNTLTELLDGGQQVILTTYDSKLADWAATHHDARGPVTFDLNLLDVVLGTEPTQTSDAFSRYLLQAEDNLNAPTAAGRRSACVAYRSAAERLAKQIIATNRSDAGMPCSVADVEREAKQLGDLVPLVRGFVLSNDEAGKWSVMPKVLNPGNHDDAVPSTIELKQIRGNLRAISKTHRAKWGALAG